MLSLCMVGREVVGPTCLVFGWKFSWLTPSTIRYFAISPLNFCDFEFGEIRMGRTPRQCRRFGASLFLSYFLSLFIVLFDPDQNLRKFLATFLWIGVNQNKKKFFCLCSIFSSRRRIKDELLFLFYFWLSLIFPFEVGQGDNSTNSNPFAFISVTH